jgi:formylglycine-generating enzyme required for sulfatase activity
MAVNHIPNVFISSTAEDLKDYRAAARDAALRGNFLPQLHEYWAAHDNPPYDECMQRVKEADVLVVILAHRYGWVPDDQPSGGDKSITWLECDQAVGKEIEVLAFILDESVGDWPERDKEEFELTRAMQEGRATPELFASVNTRVQALKNLKAWLNERAIRSTFTNPEDLRGKVESALRAWRDRHPDAGEVRLVVRAQHYDPTKYLQDLRADCGEISIRGLAVGTGKAHSFPIDELYIELSTAGEDEGGRGKGQPAGAGHRLLKQALGQQPLLVIGDPGSGKTTFMRWIAWVITGDRLGETTDAAIDRLDLGESYYPVWVRVADWLEHIEAVKVQQLPGPTQSDSAKWLPHFLGHCADDANQGLDAGWFTDKLKAGEMLVLLDGLDEAPDERRRELALRLIRAVTKAYGGCPLVVTSRPVAGADRSALPGFDLSRIEPLGDEAVATFLSRWSQALFKDNRVAADKHRQDLLSALHARPNIRRLARNTVMLTALAVVHWNEKRLPEQRAELYESILGWLARSREQRPGRTLPDRTLEILRELALAMHLHPDGRMVQVPRRWAAEQIADAFGDPQSHLSVDRAERFLGEEEIDSGIVVSRGHDIRFWHLTFQEYLVARAVGGRSEAQQRSLLLEPPQRFYALEWREPVLLLGGVLYTQGRAKVDGLLQAVLDALHQDVAPALSQQARTAGLLGALVQDLAPFDYAPADNRYARLMQAALAVFDRRQALGIPVKTRIEAAEALGQSGDPRLQDEARRWVEIPGGQFLMGAQQTDPEQPGYDDEARENEAPPHPVALDAFRIGRWPVTVSEYALFLDDGGYADARWWQAGGHGRWSEPQAWENQSHYPNRPVISVSWFEAAAFCAWLTERRRATGLARSPREWIRLPTEAEWEFAARGAEGRRYPWGEAQPGPELLNFNKDIGAVTPVGIYPQGATSEGTLDLAGNVWEWCADWYSDDYYQTCFDQGTVRNPVGPEQGKQRLLRGGSWILGSWLARAAFRDDFVPDGRSDDFGFRVLLCMRQD